MTWGKGVATRKVPRHALSHSPRKNCHSIWPFSICAWYTLRLQNCRNMCRLQCFPYQVVYMKMSGESSRTLPTAETMDSSGFHLSAAWGWHKGEPSPSPQAILSDLLSIFNPSKGIGIALSQCEAWGAETAKSLDLSRMVFDASNKWFSFSWQSGISQDFCFCGCCGEKKMLDFSDQLKNAKEKQGSWIPDDVMWKRSGMLAAYAYIEDRNAGRTMSSAEQMPNPPNR